MDEVVMITSKQNEVYKHLLKLKKAKYRDTHQEAVIFGHDLVDEARKANKIIHYLSTAPHGSHLVISKELMDTLIDYDMKEPIGALVSLKQDTQPYNRNILLCDTIQDPRNLGALIRSAHAFGFHKIILSPTCVDPYHELALRAAKGSTFHLSIEVQSLKEVIPTLKKASYQIIASSHLPQTQPLTNAFPCALILGNEGHGISKDILDLADTYFHIQTQGVESLNVSVAGSIMMHQLAEKV
jgi:TrmH family RNA methyltransferase